MCDTPYETKINSNLILNFTYFCRKIPIVGTIGGELFQLGKFRHYISMLLIVKSMVGVNPITHGIFDPAVPRGDSTPPLENTLGGV